MPVDQRDCRHPLDRRLVQMLFKKVLVKRQIIVIIMAARPRAGVEGQVLVGLAVLADVGVARDAIIHGNRHRHRPGDLGMVLDMTGEAFRGVELRQPIGVAGIVELAGGVVVL